MKRPIGVTVIAILAIIGAVLSFFGALPLLGISGLTFVSLYSVPSGVVAVGSSMLLGIGAWLLISGIFGLVFGIGALQLKSWAWTLGVVLYGLTLLGYVVSFFSVGVTASVVVGIVVSAVILGYLYTHDVREAFGHLPHSTSGTGTPIVTH